MFGYPFLQEGDLNEDEAANTEASGHTHSHRNDRRVEVGEGNAENGQSQAREDQRSLGYQARPPRAQEREHDGRYERAQPIGSDKQAEEPGSCAILEGNELGEDTHKRHTVGDVGHRRNGSGSPEPGDPRDEAHPLTDICKDSSLCPGSLARCLL